MKTGFFTIYNPKLAAYLMTNGFPLLKVAKNSKTGRDCYLFGNTHLLHDYIDRWQLERANNIYSKELYNDELQNGKGM